MKSITLAAAIAVVAFPGMLKAQEGFKVGGKLGLNMANIVSNQDFFESKSKLGLHVGPTMHYGIGDEGRFSIGADLLFSMKGCKVLDKPYSLNYIDLPIYARYRFGFGMFLETGFDLGFLMSAKMDGEDVKDNVNGMDFGYLFGLGYIHHSGLGISYRYNLGLKDLNKSSDDIDNIGTSLNTVGQISLMYYLGWED